jgi:alanine-synthesizing transaminase
MEDPSTADQAKVAFSKRTAWDTAETPLARALRERKDAGLPLADLTASNPTRCGFRYPDDLLVALQDLQALDYDPSPQGMLRAREAVCDYYRDHGAALHPEQVVLTTSTSEGYSFLFRLLCDPGDEVLISQPSYPLFDFLAVLDDVRLVPYPLVYDHGWQIDLEGLRRKIDARTRAIALVHPNNPTGHFTKKWEREALESLCREHGLALIVDEVFVDYGFETRQVESFAVGEPSSLTFVLSGLSKVAGLPQMKAAWILCLGPGRERAQARLEIIADTFLSMNAPIQCALPLWLKTREEIQSQIRDRVSGNLRELDRQLAVQTMVTRLEVEGGWYAALRIPALKPDEETAIDLLQKGVSFHPGYFFGFPEAGWLVASLLGDPQEFARGIGTLLASFANY